MTAALPLVTTIGGGTGTYPVLAALREGVLDLGAVVAMADSGGSSGRLRDEFGFPPVGDLRQSLTAIANDTSQEWIKRLLLYRFKQGQGLLGHSLGNLLLTALQDETGSTTQALQIATKIFQLAGTIIPISDQATNLLIRYQDGSELLGEHRLDLASAPQKPIQKIFFSPLVKTNPEALKRIRASHAVIIGPGDLYASLHAVLRMRGVHQALAAVPQVIFILNLINRRSQTAHFTARDYLVNIEAVIKRPLTQLLLNSTPIPASTRVRYEREGDDLIRDDLGTDIRVIRAPLLSSTLNKKDHSLSLLRHDPSLLRPVLLKLLKIKARS